MKKAWKIVLVLAATLLVLGIVCGATGLLMGGSVADLYKNDAARDAIYGLSKEYIADLVGGIFGA